MTPPRWSLLTLLFVAAPIQAADALHPPAPVAALAYLPAGNILAVGDYGRVLLIDTANGNLIQTQPSMAGPVPTLAVTAGRLAVAGGTSGKPAELRIYALTDGRISGEPVALKGHVDAVLGLAFSP